MSISRSIPGWPFEWVSGRGRYQGKAESLVLIHYTGLAVEPAGKAFFLTARDRKRRVWSTVLTLDDEALLVKFERALAGMLNAPLRELGGVGFDAEESVAPSPPPSCSAGGTRGITPVERSLPRSTARVSAAAQ